MNTTHLNTRHGTTGSIGNQFWVITRTADGGKATDFCQAVGRNNRIETQFITHLMNHAHWNGCSTRNRNP